MLTTKIIKIFEKIKYRDLIIISILAIGAPFMTRPHAFEKMEMLFSGNLIKPVDQFDLLMHLFPICLIALKKMITPKVQS